MKMKLLCATDGSHASEKAIDWSVQLIKTLLDCNMDVSLTFLTASAIAEDGEAVHGVQIMKEAIDEQIYQELHSARAKALKAGVTAVTCAKASGRNIAAAIVDFADREGYDHVICGSTGRTGVARMLLGSVASEVVAKAHCPVTVVR